MNIPDGHKRRMKPPKDTLPPNTIRRDKWDAVPPKVFNFGINHPVSNILVDNSGTEPCSTEAECTKIIKDLQTNHMTVHDMPDIKQNFLIGGDGNLYVARGWVSDAALTGEHKERLTDTLYFSYFGPKGRQPTDIELNTFNQVMDIGKNNEFIVENPKIHLEL
ncbi:peptidoglycan recognition protein-like isoform X2 [Macrosteles quadrilineatus]|uniref:peptidoglycan recognition protein-like isoform X2 n=1 Tax=Macrosteles quadrilineatus TaxID=74068 RepID=UPI0023E29777|nr:peptidoglycan recognition protein-like isoform X2 [Macrosteles quadrilineatus]